MSSTEADNLTSTYHEGITPEVDQLAELRSAMKEILAQLAELATRLVKIDINGEQDVAAVTRIRSDIEREMNRLHGKLRLVKLRIEELEANVEPR